MRVVLIGGAGHASDVLGAFEAVSRHRGEQKHPVIGIVADGEVDTHRLSPRGVRQIGLISDLKHIDASHYIVAVGFSQPRQAVTIRVAQFGLKPATVIHPKADIPDDVTIGEGTVILSGALVSPTARIGNHVCLSSGCIIGHGCQIQDFATVLPGAVISGDTVLGEASMIGANATIVQRLKIGARATVGAGAVVLKNVPRDIIVVGNPAKALERLAPVETE